MASSASPSSLYRPRVFQWNGILLAEESIQKAKLNSVKVLKSTGKKELNCLTFFSLTLDFMLLGEM